MTDQSWVNECPIIISVCDTDGIMLSMNDRAVQNFEDQGGEGLIGTDIYECHPEPSRSKFKRMMKEEKTNATIFNKGNAKYMFYQAPWYENGELKGFVEIGFEIPEGLAKTISDD